MPTHKILWSSAEGRHLVLEEQTMGLHVLRLEAGAPTPTPPLSPEHIALLRPLDWSSAARIVGPANMPTFAEALVAAAWTKVSQVALIFLNAPDNWPARTSFRHQAAMRGTAIAPQAGMNADTPLDALGVGGFTTQKISQEIRAHGKFATIEDLAKRVRETSLDGIRRSIVQIIAAELTGAPRQAMFFGNKDGKTRFRDLNAAPPADKDDD